MYKQILTEEKAVKLTKSNIRSKSSGDKRQGAEDDVDSEKEDRNRIDH